MDGRTEEHGSSSDGALHRSTMNIYEPPAGSPEVPVVLLFGEGSWSP